MAKPLKKAQARKRRREGNSIKDIAQALNVSRSSVSVWCRDITLTKAQIEHLKQKEAKGRLKGRLKGAETNKRKKQQRIEYWKNNGLKEFEFLTKRDIALVGAALYWAEGSKTRPRLSFSNSDPRMIKFIQLWLREYLGVKNRDLVLRVQINHIHKPRIEKVLNFWSQLLELPRSQFKKPFYVKTKNTKRYENHDNYYGIMVLRVRKSSEVVYKVLGQIEALTRRGSSVG